MITIDIDSGGTFTDASLTETGRRTSVKTPTTPHDLTICFLRALESLAAACERTLEDLVASTGLLRFSTTVGTNAVIERRGPRLGLLTTTEAAGRVRGLDSDRLPAALLTPATDTVIDVPRAVDRAGLVEAVEKLLAGSAERIVLAVPDGDEPARVVEARWRDLIERSYPRHILGAVPVALSTDVAGDDEFLRRLGTAVLNAFLHPTLEHFFHETEEILRRRGARRPMQIFGNDGTSNRVTKTTALRTYNSGPVGGAEAVAVLARTHGLTYAVGVDIGGTSSDLSFVADGATEEDPRGRVGGSGLAGAEVSLPMRRVEALGGGGGTVARPVGSGVALGPDSVGGAPGPACFGFGGAEAAVTDADVVLGRVAPDAVLAGEIRIDADRARAAIAERLAGPLDTTPESAALAVARELERTIAEALSRGARDRGFPMEDTTLVAFGGAGPVHAAGIAAAAGLSRVLVPGEAAVLSTLGIGASDVEHRYQRRVEVSDLDRVAAETVRRAHTDMAGEGFEADRVDLHRTLVAIDADGAELGRATEPAGLPAATARVLLELRAVGRLDHAQPTPAPRGAEAVSRRHRPAAWDGPGVQDTPVWDAAELAAGRTRTTGPAFVEGATLALAVPPGWAVQADDHGNFLLTTEPTHGTA